MHACPHTQPRPKNAEGGRLNVLVACAGDEREDGEGDERGTRAEPEEPLHPVPAVTGAAAAKSHVASWTAFVQIGARCVTACSLRLRKSVRSQGNKQQSSWMELPVGIQLRRHGRKPVPDRASTQRAQPTPRRTDCEKRGYHVRQNQKEPQRVERRTRVRWVGPQTTWSTP